MDADIQQLPWTMIVGDIEYLHTKLSKKLNRTRLLRHAANRGCQILKGSLGCLKVASLVAACVPSAEVGAFVCMVTVIPALEVVLHLLQKCARSLSCKCAPAMTLL